MIAFYTTKFNESKFVHDFGDVEKGKGVSNGWYFNSREATKDDRINATIQCGEYLMQLSRNYPYMLDFTGLHLVSTMQNIDDSSNPYVSLTLERPMKMSSNYYGHPDISMDFEAGKRYNLLMNFQKNTTNMTQDAVTLTNIQIANDSLAVINST